MMECIFCLIRPSGYVNGKAMQPIGVVRRNDFHHQLSIISTVEFDLELFLRYSYVEIGANPRYDHAFSISPGAGVRLTMTAGHGAFSYAA